ncbi:unnamed protein product [Echinostoma caproni]|uniref:Uncharacterized protein n=1 Tax=Echinostoma caproni TaxID=27848 RepID=A0A183A8I7_9TREM|nr:unnamed protein product [Echinostoma caproni]
MISAHQLPLALDEDTFPMRQDEATLSTEHSSTDLLGLIHEQAFEIKELKARLSIFGDQLANLQALLLTSVPTTSAANTALKLSQQEILDAAKKLRASEQCAKRVIFWKRFSMSDTLESICKHICSLLQPLKFKPLSCTWLTAKGSPRRLGLLVDMGSSKLATDVLIEAPTLKRSWLGLRGVSIDKPLHVRLSQPKLKGPKVDPRDAELLRSAFVSAVRLDSKVLKSQPSSPDPIPLDETVVCLKPMAASSTNNSFMEQNQISTEASGNQKQKKLKIKKPTKPTPARKLAPPDTRRGLLGEPPSIIQVRLDTLRKLPVANIGPTLHSANGCSCGVPSQLENGNNREIFRTKGAIGRPPERLIKKISPMVRYPSKTAPRPTYAQTVRRQPLISPPTAQPIPPFSLTDSRTLMDAFLNAFLATVLVSQTKFSN